MPTAPLIVLTTDFGLTDPFVGIMKGVIAQITPCVRLIDLNHNIPTGDIRRAAITLFQSCSFFPLKTIFLTIIDPGVGTYRRGIILHTNNYTFIGPDNGLFTYLLDESTEIWELTNPIYQLPNQGSTFHGRDIFAPCAAYVAQGVHGSKFGPSVFDEVRIPYPKFEMSTNGLKGEVLYSDRFGNILTSLGKFTRINEQSFSVTPWVRSFPKPTQDIQIDMKQAFLHLPSNQKLPWVNTFADIEEGLCAGLVGSSGLMEIVANERSAAEILNLSESDAITLRF